MIVSASYRTDIPAFYARWFLRRLNAGSCTVANPYGGGTYEVSLRPGEVDGFVFWTRNIRPLLPELDAVRRVAPFVVQFTVTGYPRALETSVIPPDDAVAPAARTAPPLRRPRRGVALRPDRFRRRARCRGASCRLRARWRARFPARSTRSSCRSCIPTARPAAISTGRPRGTASPGAIRRPEEKRDLLRRLGAIAREHGIAPTLCSQPDLLAPGLGEASCIDAGAAGRCRNAPVAARERGNRPGCRCAESRDIGAYDTCPHGCVYCYAVTDRDRAVANFRGHDPDAARLLG